jgi:Family of unknown function (DUF6953)
VTRQPPPDLPERKPVADMTREERLEYAGELRRIIRQEMAELNRAGRERKLRRGLVPPRNAAERELFLADYHDEQPRAGARRTERHARRQQPPQDGREGITAGQLPDNATAGDVARWMADCLERDGHLDQLDAAHELAGRFGEQFTRLTANGHLAISKRVLRAFREAAGGPSWDQRTLCWLPRTEDGSGQVRGAD